MSNIEINIEEFIAIKGIKALGNQLTTDKVKQINLLEPLPYEAPDEIHADELEVIDAETIQSEEKIVKPKPNEKDSDNNDLDGEGQITLF